MSKLAWCRIFAGVFHVATGTIAWAGQPANTSATLKVLDIRGQDIACQNLLDVQFTIANADVSAEGFYTQYPRFDVNTLESEEFKKFRVEREEQLYRETFTEEEREELKKIEPRYHSVIYLMDEAEKADIPPLAKRMLKFNRTIFQTIVDEYTTKRVETTESRRQSYFEALRTRSDTQFTKDGKGFITINDEFRKQYVRQHSAETCYAAVLMTVWQYFGWPARYTDFVDGRVPRCELSAGRRESASFNEIVSTIYHLRTSSAFPLFNWTGDKEGARLLAMIKYTQTLKAGILMESTSTAYINRPLPRTLLAGVASLATPWSLLLMNSGQGQLEQLQRQMNEKVRKDDGKTPNLFQKFDWHQTSNPSIEGYLMPLGHTGQLVAALLSGDAVIVGIENQRYGHTLLVTGVEYEPQFFMQGDNAVFTPSTRIRRVRLLDPGPLVEPEYWEENMGRFFTQFRFGIVIHQDR
jgi:hypothetical protein